jgi:hypothetical protein
MAKESNQSIRSNELKSKTRTTQIKQGISKIVTIPRTENAMLNRDNMKNDARLLIVGVHQCAALPLQQ